MKSLGDITKKFVPPEKRFDFKSNLIYNNPIKKGVTYMKRKLTEQQKQYNAEYQKENYTKINMKLKHSEDGDLIEWLNEQKEWGYSFNEICKAALRDYFEHEDNYNH